MYYYRGILLAKLFLIGKFILSSLLKFSLPAWILLISFSTSVLFGLRSMNLGTNIKPIVSVYQESNNDGASPYDRRQDDRMTSSDEREKEFMGEVSERRKENDEFKRDYETKYSEDHDRIVRDEAYFSGAFFILSVLSAFNLLRKVPKESTLPMLERELKDRTRLRDEYEQRQHRWRDEDDHRNDK